MRTLPANFMLILTVVAMNILTGMEFDLFVPSFPQLQSHFNLSAFWVEALLSVNFIGYCLSLFIIAKWADQYARKTIISLGLLTFIIGSLFCLYSHFYFFLLLGRFLQGIGIAAPAVLSFLIIADRYPLKEQQFLMAMLNGIMNIAVGISPVMGSYIALYFQWRGNFIALLGLGLIAFFMTFLFIPNVKPLSDQKTQSTSETNRLFQFKPLLLLIMNIIVMCVPYWIFVGISPLLYIKALHVNLTNFGFYQGLLAFVFAIGCLVYGFIVHYFSQKAWLGITLFIFIIAFLMILWVTTTQNTHPLLITLSILVFVIGQIIPCILLYPLCLNFMPEGKAKISAIIQGGRLAFSALGLEIAGYFYDGSFYTIGIIIEVFVLMSILTQFYIFKSEIINKKLNDLSTP